MALQIGCHNLFTCLFVLQSHKLYLYFLNIIIIIYNYNIIIYILYLKCYFLFNNDNKQIYNNSVFLFWLDTLRRKKDQLTNKQTNKNK